MQLKDLPEFLNRKKEEIRPAPFWSLNDRMEPEILREQVREMAKAGLGGFFMHARVGINTEYMSKDWYECILACMEEAKKYNVDAWGYDENGYPSGIADGEVCKASEDFKVTWIELVPVEKITQGFYYEIIAYYRKKDGKWEKCDESKADTVLIRKNESRSADPMNTEGVDLFIELAHEAYRKQYPEDIGEGRVMPGFFTDEPQLKMFQLPWTKDLDKIFLDEYGYELLEHIPCLKYDLPGKEKVRNDYWKLISRLYCEGFGKRVYDWCKNNGCLFTGHVMGEDSILEQMASNAGAMAFYEYFDIPGMDWLGRQIGGPLTPKQVSSVAAQLGRKKVLSETFALSGWDVSFEELKWIAQWQFVNGVNFLCPHLESYSLRGMRKRDYPPSLFIQQNWWEEYNNFTDYVSGIGAMISQSQEICDVLVIHPLFSAYTLFDTTSDCEAVKKIDRDFENICRRLQGEHIGYHFGDETIIRKYGEIKGNKLCIGEKEYGKVLLPDLCNITSETFKILEKFQKCSGKIYYTGNLPKFIDGIENSVTEKLNGIKVFPEDFKSNLEFEKHNVSIKENGREAEDVLCSKRILENNFLLYIVNTDLNRTRDISVTVSGINALCELNIENYTVKHLDFEEIEGKVRTEISLAGAQSVVLVSGGKGNSKTKQARKRKYIGLAKNFEIEQSSMNLMTLDRCDFSVAGKEWEEDIPIILMQRRLMDKQTDALIKMRFFFDIQEGFLPETMFLLWENAPEFSLYVNGREVEYKDEGWYIDRAFKKTDIRPFVKEGKNEIILQGRFWQRKELYEWLYREKDLSSNFYGNDFEFNTVTYDTEIESVYLMGDFCVESLSPYTFGPDRAVFSDGPFVITPPAKSIEKGNITVRGYPFFSGRMKLSWEEDINMEDGVKYILKCKKPVCPAAVVYVNGQRAGNMNWEPAEIDVTDKLEPGENRFSMELISGHRNMLGPHHFKEGESHYVGISTFTDTPGWCEQIKKVSGNIFVDRYCFVEFGFSEDEDE